MSDIVQQISFLECCILRFIIFSKAGFLIHNVNELHGWW